MKTLKRRVIHLQINTFQKSFSTTYSEPHNVTKIDKPLLSYANFGQHMKIVGGPIGRNVDDELPEF